MSLLGFIIRSWTSQTAPAAGAPGALATANVDPSASANFKKSLMLETSSKAARAVDEVFIDECIKKYGAGTKLMYGCLLDFRIRWEEKRRRKE